MDKRILLPEIQKFILENEKADVYDLLLKYRELEGIPFPLIADQIRSRASALKKLPSISKIAGWYYPPPISLEQCSSELTAEYKSKLLKGPLLTDLTGGTGIDSIFFAREFSKVNYIESESELCDLFRQNISLIGLDNIEIINSNAETYISNHAELGTVYIDPSRRDEKERVYGLEESHPNIFEIWDELKTKSNGILVKASPMVSVPEVIQKLDTSLEIHFVSVKNELKEILLYWNPEINETRFVCVNLESPDPECKWSSIEEELAEVDFSDPLKYLYEPNSSIMKAGGYKFICGKYGVKKLDKNTHLYTSEKLMDFPGRRFEFVRVMESKDLKRMKKANVAVRNYPLKPEEIKRKYKISDGGEEYIYACTLTGGRKSVLQLKRLV